jgi:hypothetical protein
LKKTNQLVTLLTTYYGVRYKFELSRLCLTIRRLIWPVARHDR